MSVSDTKQNLYKMCDLKRFSTTTFTDNQVRSLLATLLAPAAG